MAGRDCRLWRRRGHRDRPGVSLLGDFEIARACQPRTGSVGWSVAARPKDERPDARLRSRSCERRRRRRRRRNRIPRFITSVYVRDRLPGGPFFCLSSVVRERALARAIFDRYGRTFRPRIFVIFHNYTGVFRRYRSRTRSVRVPVLHGFPPHGVSVNMFCFPFRGPTGAIVIFIRGRAESAFFGNKPLSASPRRCLTTRLFTVHACKQNGRNEIPLTTGCVENRKKKFPADDGFYKRISTEGVDPYAIFLTVRVQYWPTGIVVWLINSNTAHRHPARSRPTFGPIVFFFVRRLVNVEEHQCCTSLWWFALLEHTHGGQYLCSRKNLSTLPEQDSGLAELFGVVVHRFQQLFCPF